MVNWSQRLAQLAAVTFTALWFITITSTPLQAQTTTDVIIIEPTFQEIFLNENQATTSGTIRLANRSGDTFVVKFQAADIQQFNADGQVILSDKPLTGSDFALSSFIELPLSTETIAPDSELTIPFIIRNDQSLSPGGHYAALIAALRPLEPASNSAQVLPAVSSFVLLHKQGGDRYHLSLGEVALPKITWKLPHSITLRFSNQGNVHLVPRGTVTLTNGFNRLISKNTLNENSLIVLPQTERDIEQSLTPGLQFWPGMMYTIRIEGTSNLGEQSVAQTQQFLVISPIGVGLILCGIGCIITLVLVQRRRHAKT